jgi:hypothetical protein
MKRLNIFFTVTTFFILNLYVLANDNEQINSSQELAIKVNDGDIFGTYLEASNNKNLIVIIISGSGPTDRDGNSAMMGGKNNSLKMLTEGLYNNGFSSFRYDKRMIGKSSGFPSEENTGFNDFIEDAESIINYFKKSGFDKVVIAGHSEGSLIGTVAARKTDADGFISICGLAKDMGVTIIEQLEQRAPTLVEDAKAAIDSIKNGRKLNITNPQLKMIFRESIVKFMSEVMSYYPAIEIKKLDIPILIINGKHDIQVDYIDGKLLDNAAKNSQYYAIDSMNHVLKNTPKTYLEQISSYGNPNLEINKELINRITSYLKSLN